MVIFHSYVSLPEGNLVGGFNMFQHTPLKNDGRIVSWDDEIPYGKS